MRVAEDSVQVPEATGNPVHLVSATTASTRLPEWTEEPEPSVGTTESHTQLPVVVEGPEHIEDSVTFEAEPKPKSAPGESGGGGVSDLAILRWPPGWRRPRGNRGGALVAAPCPRARARGTGEMLIASPPFGGRLGNVSKLNCVRAAPRPLC